MKYNEFHYFFLIFKVLFVAQKEYKYYQEWVLSKRKNDDLLNELCVNYLANFTKSKRAQDSNEEQKDLILLASILRKQFKIRALVTMKFYFLKSINLKCLIAIIWLYTQLLKNYIFQIFSIPFEFQIDKDALGKKINFTIGFPHHSFNFKKNQTSFPSSFAEYVVFSQIEVDKQDFLISLDGYQRKSIKKDSSAHSLDSEIHILEVINADKKISMKSILERVRYIFQILTHFRPQSIALYLAECSQKMLIISHLIFIEKMKNYNQVLKVYILPFSDYLMLPFSKEVQGHSNVYYYSDNMLIPPTAFFFDGLLPEKLNKFEDGNYSSIYGIKGAAGFVRVNNYLNKIAHDIFLSQEKEGPIIEKELPSMLGFERLLKVEDFHEAYIVSIFDVPPESSFLQFCRSATADKTSDIEFVSEFLSDLKNKSFNSDVKFLYKPKYALINYSEDYRTLITSLQDFMGKRFIVLDPYVRVGDIIEKSDLVISFPYTSTKRFAEFYGKKSRYYVPTKYSEFFRAYSGYSAETIYGNKELLNFINGQR
jgi:hypothetical protein